MGAVQTMSVGMVRPVGNAIAVFSQQKSADPFGGLLVKFYGSGTMSLAAALMALRAKTTAKATKVIVPAYACPDIISAIKFSGVTPVLVDLEPERPWMDLEQLARKIDVRTLAVVGAHFLGIPERIEKIKEVCQGFGVAVVEDSAQAFPLSEHFWKGDFVILSFGRGKPVSVLGGGAVLTTSTEDYRRLPQGADRRSTWAGGVLKILLYNAALLPWVYRFVESIPFLEIGETRLRCLHHLTQMDPFKNRVLDENIRRYKQSEKRAQRNLAQQLPLEKSGIADLPAVCGSLGTPLLRYPLLARDELSRERLIGQLRSEGISASRLYGKILPCIRGLSALGGRDEFPHANDFAKRLITLPVHEGVTEKHVSVMRAAVELASLA